MEKFDIAKATELTKKIDYSYKDIKLLEEALSHPSLKQQSKDGELRPNYERLELLGDAILSLIIIEILFIKFPHYTEGEIAKIKSYLVSKEIIFNVAGQIELQNYIIMTKGEENSGGRENPGNIENAMEALIGSVYLDGDLPAAKKLINFLWYEALNNINYNEIDPKTHLQEWAQSHKYNIPAYEVINTEGAPHIPVFTVKVTTGTYTACGKGSSVKLAEKDAAKKLLAQIE